MGRGEPSLAFQTFLTLFGFLQSGDLNDGGARGHVALVQPCGRGRQPQVHHHQVRRETHTRFSPSKVEPIRAVLVVKPASDHNS